jgi:NitT/TauT family transport system permease protein
MRVQPSFNVDMVSVPGHSPAHSALPRRVDASILRKATGLAGLIALWETISRLQLVDPQVLPPPSDVVRRAATLVGDPTFASGTVSTILSWLIALGGATLIGIVLGLAIGSSPALQAIGMPIVEFLRPLPSVALIPLAISVFGIDAETKIVLAVFAATWPILMNTIYAFEAVDAEQLEIARCFRVSRRRQLTGVVLPSIGPFVLTGVRISASTALIALVATEFLAGGSVGIGQYANVWGAAGGRMDVVLAVTTFAGLLGCGINAAFLALQRKWMPWSAGEDAL